MKQTDLFGEPGLEPKRVVIAREKREQEKQIVRVTGRIRYLIQTFLACRSACSPPTFTMRELQAYVAGGASVAPGSTDRILRLLRRDGHLNYRVVNRAASLYEVLSVNPNKET